MVKLKEWTLTYALRAPVDPREPFIGRKKVTVDRMRVEAINQISLGEFDPAKKISILDTIPYVINWLVFACHKLLTSRLSVSKSAKESATLLGLVSYHD
jgi:hypothetical protein